MDASRIVAIAAGLCIAAALDAQVPASLPFASGERLTFRVQAWKFGTIGHAVMAVSGPVTVRGVEAMVLSVDTGDSASGSARIAAGFRCGSRAHCRWWALG